MSNRDTVLLQDAILELKLLADAIRGFNINGIEAESDPYIACRLEFADVLIAKAGG